MKYELTSSAQADFKRLREDEKALFRRAVRDFNTACDSVDGSSGSVQWPRSLRIKSVVDAPGVWEMTWSFSGPDGRATWEWTTVTEGGAEHRAVRWRRIGGHAIFRDP